MLTAHTIVKTVYVRDKQIMRDTKRCVSRASALLVLASMQPDCSLCNRITCETTFGFKHLIEIQMQAVSVDYVVRTGDISEPRR